MTNTVDEMRAKILFDVIKEPCGMDTILSTEDLCRDFKIGDGSVEKYQHRNRKRQADNP